MIRPATTDDLDAMVALSSRARRRLEEHEPVFWRRHEDADTNQRAWLGFLLDDPNHHLVVSGPEPGPINGFGVARAMDAPPVYDPGGRTCLVDDLVWADRTTADGLLAAIRAWAAEQGCTQLVVVTPAADRDRRALLGDQGLHPTSEWWTGPV